MIFSYQLIFFSFRNITAVPISENTVVIAKKAAISRTFGVNISSAKKASFPLSRFTPSASTNAAANAIRLIIISRRKCISMKQFTTFFTGYPE